MTETLLIDYRSERGVALITLAHPPANAFSYEMLAQLDAAVLRARIDDDVHVIVLSGSRPSGREGERREFFCAGADLHLLDRSSASFKYYFCLYANEAMLRLEHTPKLVIAALNGHALGAGLELALACDLRVARRGGGKLGLPEVSLGMMPGTGGTQRLSRALGKSKAIELMVSGETLSFEAAQALGLLHKIFDEDADEFLPAVMAYASTFAPPHKASLAVGRIKRAVQSGWEVPLETGLTLERELLQQLFESADTREGIRAFEERRKPIFTGK